MAKFESSTVVKRKQWAEFGKNTPGETAIREIFQRFCEAGTVEDRERPGRPSEITEEKIDEVAEVIENEPQSSVRSVATACSIMKKICKTGLRYEVTFYLNGLVNKHNVRYWPETNPHVTIETVMKSPKLNVWCAISKNQLVGPYFFEDDTVNGNNYLSMLQNFFIWEVRKLHNVRSIVFQQDGASAPFSTDVRQYLDNHFPNRWIRRGGPIRWAPRSPDLTPLDFVLWGHVKSNIYKTRVKNVAELKRRINIEI
ncbi:unnamed protein product [Rotaria socialis]|uniref:DUF4817 domain-containing protein n=1 Tax=Rotaria socialis TaxID=392032 RepID=A0A818G2X5_9BILA|nr:unnamed protein product [Rotaria socialis]CAF4683129.1 unnamed protein product [Rotaria socialis]